MQLTPRWKRRTSKMAEVNKIATRDSYGNTLKELAAEGHDELVVLQHVD